VTRGGRGPEHVLRPAASGVARPVAARRHASRFSEDRNQACFSRSAMSSGRRSALVGSSASTSSCTARTTSTVCAIRSTTASTVSPTDTRPAGYGDSSVVVATVSVRRSEEHTSELQSRENLVCRLLLEKKNKRVMTFVCSLRFKFKKRSQLTISYLNLIETICMRLSLCIWSYVV